MEAKRKSTHFIGLQKDTPHIDNLQAKFRCHQRKVAQVDKRDGAAASESFAKPEEEFHQGDVRERMASFQGSLFFSPCAYVPF